MPELRKLPALLLNFGFELHWNPKPMSPHIDHRSSLFHDCSAWVVPNREKKRGWRAPASLDFRFLLEPATFAFQRFKVSTLLNIGLVVHLAHAAAAALAR